jgi:hypothetical protein
MAFRAEAFSSTTALKIQQYNRIAGFYTQKINQHFLSNKRLPWGAT